MPAPKGHPPYNKNGEGGRPVRYTTEYVNQLAELLYVWMEENKDNIFIEKWCYENDIPEEAISTDLIKNERFSKAYSKLKTKQKVGLYEGGLKRKYAHPMCALVLSHVHNIHLKTEQKNTEVKTDSLDEFLRDLNGTSKDLVNE